MNIRVLTWMVWATLASLSCGCRGHIKTITKLPPQAKAVVRDATRDELLEKYNEIALFVKKRERYRRAKAHRRFEI